MSADGFTPGVVRSTNRWVGVGAVALLAGGLGVLDREPALLLVGVLGVAFAAYARSGEAPSVSLSVTRELSDDHPDPGDDVTVTVTVENVGESTLPDLRLVDGVPPALEVVDGSARLGTALRPGKRASFEYTVHAVRGEHEWRALHAIARDASGARERTANVSGGTTLRCTPALDGTADLPLRGLTTQYSGRISTDVGGSGLEFHSVREYRTGDPLNRIDWNRLARTGDLATLEFREERAATVVLLVDAREVAYLAASESDENAVERSVDAASQAFISLLDSGDRVGVASFGPDSCWLAPNTGRDHRARARTLLATHPGLAPTPPDGQFFPALAMRRLRRRLPADAQVLLFSPLVDDYMSDVARRLDAYGHLVTVVAPDPTADDNHGRRLVRVERSNRISALRRHGIRVVDWTDDSLALDVERAARRWSA